MSSADKTKPTASLRVTLEDRMAMSDLVGAGLKSNDLAIVNAAKLVRACLDNYYSF